MWRIFFVALVMLFPVLVSASPSWQKRYTVDFRLGDADSRLDARHAALEDIRHLAAAEAESYVHSRSEYVGDEIQEHVEVVSATMVLLENIKESLALNDSGQPVLQLSADATLDDRLLDRRIDALLEREAKYERAERLEVENQRLKERVASRPDYSGNPVTLYDELSSYSSEQYIDTPSDREDLEVAAFETSVRDSDLSELIEHQVLPRIADKGVSMTPASVRKHGSGWQVSFYLDWDLPFKALERRLGDEISLVPANAYAWPGEGDNRGRKIDLRRHRRERPGSQAILDQLSRWRGDVVVTMVDQDGGQHAIHREPFWYLSQHRGHVCHSGDAAPPGAAQSANYLCLLEGNDRAARDGSEGGVYIETVLSRSQRDALAHVEADIEWRSSGGD